MKILVFIFLMTSSFAFCQQDKNRIDLLLYRLPDWTIEALQHIPAKDLKITGYINPYYLEADFNGDGLQDIVIYVEQLKTKKKGFMIVHQTTNDRYILGAGRSFGNGIDDFEWADIWKIKREKGKVGLFVEKPDSISGLISWNGTEYIISSQKE